MVFAVPMDVVGDEPHNSDIFHMAIESDDFILTYPVSPIFYPPKE